MADKKKKIVLYSSPKGVAKFPHLTKPQTVIGGKNVDPTYALDILVDPNDAEIVAFKEKIEKAHAEGLAAAKKENPKKKYKDAGTENIFRDDMKKDDEGNEEPTGKLAIRFKAKAEGNRKDGSKWTFKPALFDAKGAALPADTLVYGGSVVRVSYSIRHIAMETGMFYTKLNLEAVKVLVLKSQADREASYYGFQDEEGEEPTEETTDSTGSDATSEGAGEAPATGADF